MAACHYLMHPLECRAWHELFRWGSGYAGPWALCPYEFSVDDISQDILHPRLPSSPTSITTRPDGSPNHGSPSQLETAEALGLLCNISRFTIAAASPPLSTYASRGPALSPWHSAAP